MPDNVHPDLTKRLPRGAIPSPRHELAAAMPHVPRAGIADEQSLLNMTYEAWIRNPVTSIDFVADKTIITSDTTPKAPSIAPLNGRLYIAWKGDGNDFLNVAQ